ncbi:MAG: alpha-ketoglutarate-dependent dioxygenase AlkB [Gammaproteobacteria bacterium]
MKDLFESPGLDRLPLIDAELYLQREINLDYAAEQLVDRLIATTPWRQEQIKIYGKHYLQPRLSAWYGNQGLDYAYSGIQLSALPWTDLLTRIKSRVEAVAGQGFNSVLLNYYRNQNDSMGMHSDDETELGEQPVIASLSLGDKRNFILRHKYRKDIDSVRLVLSSGSLLIMKGDTQARWKHGIPKQRNTCGPRLNLTFRTIKKTIC